MVSFVSKGGSIRIGTGTINGKKIESCPKCGNGILPAGTYKVPNMFPDETCRCLTCGYVEREGQPKDAS